MAAERPERPEATVVDLDRIVEQAAAGDGVHWALSGNPDLNVNLVHLDPGRAVAAHVNDAVEVAVVVLAGAGTTTVDGVAHELAPHTLVVVPAGAERSLAAGDEGLTYLTVHRQRGPLAIGRRPPTTPPGDLGGDPPCWAHELDDA